MTTRLSKPTTDGVVTKDFFANHTTQLLVNASKIDSQLEAAANVMNDRLDEQTDVEGSGWVLDEITGVDLNIAAYNAVGGSSFIDTPERIKGKHAIINIKNIDNKCFL